MEAVADSYEISEDAKVYTFTLRDGVKFHNGNEVTAEDVKYSIELMRRYVKWGSIGIGVFYYREREHSR